MVGGGRGAADGGGRGGAGRAGWRLRVGAAWRWPAGRPRRPSRRRSPLGGRRSERGHLAVDGRPRRHRHHPGDPPGPADPDDGRPAASPTAGAARHPRLDHDGAAVQPARRPAGAGDRPGPPAAVLRLPSGSESASRPRHVVPARRQRRRRAVGGFAGQPAAEPEVGGRAAAAGRHHPRRRRPGGRVPGLRDPAQPGRRRPRPPARTRHDRRRLAGGQHDRHRQPRVPAGGRAGRCPGLGHRTPPRDAHRPREPPRRQRCRLLLRQPAGAPGPPGRRRPLPVRRPCRDEGRDLRRAVRAAAPTSCPRP